MSCSETRKQQRAKYVALVIVLGGFTGTICGTLVYHYLFRPKYEVMRNLSVSCVEHDGEWKKFSGSSNCEWVVHASSRDFVLDLDAQTNWCAMKSGEFRVIPGKEDSKGNYIESIDTCTFKDEG